MRVSRGVGRRHPRRPPAQRHRRRRRATQTLFERLGGQARGRSSRRRVPEAGRRRQADQRPLLQHRHCASARPAGRVRLLRDRRARASTPAATCARRTPAFSSSTKSSPPWSRTWWPRSTSSTSPRRRKTSCWARSARWRRKSSIPPSGRSEGPRCRRWRRRRAKRSPSCARLARADAADLLEVAVAARVRGQRSYAEQLYSAAERLAARRRPDQAGPAVPRGRARAHHHRSSRRCPRTRAPQPKDAVGGSDEEAREAEERIARRGR